MQAQYSVEVKEQASRILLADVHCHLDIFEDIRILRHAIDNGIDVIIGNGIDTSSNMKAIGLSDNRNIFAMMGIDPENAIVIGDDELEFNIGLIKENKNRIVGIGEIGLDNKIATTLEQKERQQYVFGRMLDTAISLKLPISVHARAAFDDVMQMLESRKMPSVHMHFFDGDEVQAKIVADHGYYISIPPVETSKRKRAIAQMPMNLIMSETDAPVVGKTPLDVAKSVDMIAKVKGIQYNDAALVTLENAHRFFNINLKRIGSRRG